MIALLNYSNAWCQNNQHSSTGGLTDSVLVSYDDLRSANIKMTQLKYSLLVNASLKKVIKNDSIIISNYKSLDEFNNCKINTIKKQRNYAIGGAALSFVALILSLLK